VTQRELMSATKADEHRALGARAARPLLGTTRASAANAIMPA